MVEGNNMYSTLHHPNSLAVANNISKLSSGYISPEDS